ncbi:pre-mRNA 3'-end-processing factor FIP1 isoform X2 [Cimex lectularius]|uniref:Pre-mRNA polyadenylation factor Fip1 domain-containing protein n=1 Tax=Cimex lectularius TaxID=79782 RepID=A0A8I6RJW6_CIMLE|nr:pre-mRNA 3'-end-processing factor FIP1 isoform X2 [Cimex lectularius]
MAEPEPDDPMNEDQWLYGDSTGDVEPPKLPQEEEKEQKQEKETEQEKEQETEREEGEAEDDEPPPTEQPEGQQTPQGEEQEKEPLEEGEQPDQGSDQIEKPSEEGGSPREAGQIDAGQDDEDEEDDDDSEDDIRVTIGDIKTAPQYSNINIKRGAVLSSGVDKLNKIQPGKFSIEEFESIGTINGLPAHEFSIDALEEKPWRKPGADITDYFNYGFNEDTWRAYCERQKQMRVHESGVGLGGLGVSRTNQALTIINDNSKYSSLNNSNIVVNNASATTTGVMSAAQRKAGPPPGPRRSGVIDVIGVGGVASRRTTDSPPKENVIQVMTADRRDYGRKGFDMSVPPPGFEATQPPMAPVVPNYPPHGGYNQDFYQDVDHYYQSYEPAQDMQWNSQVRSSRHREKKSRNSSLIPDHSKRSKPDKYMHNPLNKDDLPGGMSIKQEPMDKSFKDRERERERHKERHRHRSRSRSVDRERRRKHKSRSRSPGHRSHKKKKSKKSDRKDNSD